MINFFRVKEKKIYNHLINSIDYNETRRLKQKDEHDSIQLRLKKFEESQIENNILMSELDDINLEIEKSKVNKISKEEYYEIYLKLIEIYKKI